MTEKYTREQTAGFAAITNTLCAALLNKPSQDIIKSVHDIALEMGMDGFGDFIADSAMEQRFSDRFFVGSSRYYVPLYETSMLGSYEQNGKTYYGAARGERANHVKKCYQSVGFEYSKIDGFDLAVSKLKSDSMASQLAFMSMLANNAVVNWVGNTVLRDKCIELLDVFIRQHPSVWFGVAADAMKKADSDFYACVCSLAEAVTVAWIEEC